MIKTEGDKVSYSAITVDDCFFANTRDQEGINEAINMLKTAFEELTVERGEVIKFFTRRCLWTILLLITE